MTTMQFDFQNLFDLLGLSDLPMEEKEKRFAEMQEIVEGMIFLRIRKIIEEQAKEKGKEKIQEEWETCKTDKDLENFYHKYDINVEQIALEEATHYREELLQGMSYVQAKLEKE